MNSPVRKFSLLAEGLHQLSLAGDSYITSLETRHQSAARRTTTSINTLWTGPVE